MKRNRKPAVAKGSAPPKMKPNIEDVQGRQFTLMRLEARAVAWAAWVKGRQEGM